jgi:hypothetical protein
MTDTSTAPSLTQGPLVYTTKTLADAIGRSTQYIRTDIRNGRLAGSRASEKATYFITPAEATRYARWLAEGRPESSAA